MMRHFRFQICTLVVSAMYNSVLYTKLALQFVHIQKLSHFLWDSSQYFVYSLPLFTSTTSFVVYGTWLIPTLVSSKI